MQICCIWIFVKDCIETIFVFPFVCRWTQQSTADTVGMVKIYSAKINKV